METTDASSFTLPAGASKDLGMETPAAKSETLPTRQAKVSKAQQGVLDKMNDGWQLGMSMGYRTRYWLQKGGCGRGGPSLDVNANTAHALRNARIILVDETSFPLQTFRLSRCEDSTTAPTLTQNK